MPWNRSRRYCRDPEKTDNVRIGIFDIAGTASPYLPVYVAAALLFAAAGVVIVIRARGNSGHRGADRAYR